MRLICGHYNTQQRDWLEWQLEMCAVSQRRGLGIDTFTLLVKYALEKFIIFLSHFLTHGGCFRGERKSDFLEELATSGHSLTHSTCFQSIQFASEKWKKFFKKVFYLALNVCTRFQPRILIEFLPFFIDKFFVCQLRCEIEHDQ